MVPSPFKIIRNFWIVMKIC